MEDTDGVRNLRCPILVEQDRVDLLDAICEGVAWNDLVAQFMQVHATGFFIECPVNPWPQSRRSGVIHRPKKEGQAQDRWMSGGR